MPEQEEKAPREGATLSKSRGKPAFGDNPVQDLGTMFTGPAGVRAAQAVGKGLGRVFNPISTEQEIQNTAAEARGTVDYTQQFELWMNRFMREYSPEQYGELEDFLTAKERVMRDLPFSEGQSRADLTDELAYNEAGESYLQREAQRARRADAGTLDKPAAGIGSSMRNALRSSNGVPSNTE